jgi:hypothetical protein
LSRRLPTRDDARRILEDALDDDTAGVHPRGEAWLRGEVLPAILTITKHPNDSELLLPGWTLVGEICELVDAPRAAARAYGRALAYMPGSGELRDVRDAARKAAKEAVHGPLTEAAELLAAGRADAALAKVARLRTAEGMLARARAHGARGDVEGALVTWEALARTTGPMRLELADWFYLPADVFDAARFWSALGRLVPRLARGSVFSHADGVRDAFDPHREPPPVRVARATWKRVADTQRLRTERG